MEKVGRIGRSFQRIVIGMALALLLGCGTNAEIASQEESTTQDESTAQASGESHAEDLSQAESTSQEAESTSQEAESTSQEAEAGSNETADVDPSVSAEESKELPVAVPVKINATNFPDPKFRAVVSERDLDGNGTLDIEEIGLTLNIYCEGMHVKSLQGIEYFVDLQGLWCKDNEIETMDLSNLKDLRGVWCSGNKFTSLDFSENPELTWVYCYDCNLTSLNLANNPKMAYVECNTNPLPTLDVTHNPELEHLTCGSCELTT
ncbi:MAG: hypothetical protein J5721_08335, partial [Lachnospiraceae bacterium]|nr:hypothetical protein [Lachnospiraceae bacterium]